MSSAHNIILVHGAYGYPTENWFDWLKKSMNALDIDCIVPALPTPHHQSLSRWMEVFDHGYASDIHDQSILIGHSLGGAFILRWLESHLQNVSTVILVGPFLGPVGLAHFDEINQSFFQTPFDWITLRNRAQTYVAYDGDHDPYISPLHFQWITQQLNATKIIISQGGHLNTQAGYTTFPHLLCYLKHLIQEQSHD